MRTALWQSPAPTQPRSTTSTPGKEGSFQEQTLMWWSGTLRDPSMKLDPAFHRHHRAAGGSLRAFIFSSSLKSLPDVRCCFLQDHLCGQPGPGRRRQPVRGPPLPWRSLGHYQSRAPGLREWNVHVRSGLGEVLSHEDLPRLPVQEDGAASKGLIWFDLFWTIVRKGGKNENKTLNTHPVKPIRSRLWNLLSGSPTRGKWLRLLTQERGTLELKIWTRPLAPPPDMEAWGTCRSPVSACLVKKKQNENLCHDIDPKQLKNLYLSKSQNV